MGCQDGLRRLHKQAGLTHFRVLWIPSSGERVWGSINWAEKREWGFDLMSGSRSGITVGQFI